MKKVLIIGGNGLLGQCLIKRFNGLTQIYSASLEDKNYLPEITLSYQRLDITNRSQVKDLIHKIKPDIIFNAAAFTDVDRCEEDRELCWNANVRAADNIIESAAALRPVLVHFSTDYVFDGNESPYCEIDTPNPRGNYARSKMASENIVRTSELEYLIIRTQILYGTGNNVRPNFVTWLIAQLLKKNSVRVVTDQIGNPTYAPDVAEAAYRLLQNECYGLYHVSSPDSLSRYEFALSIAREFDLDAGLINKISTSELNQKAPRPMNSSFRLDKFVNSTGWLPHDVESALKLLKQELEKKNG